MSENGPKQAMVDYTMRVCSPEIPRREAVVRVFSLRSRKRVSGLQCPQQTHSCRWSETRKWSYNWNPRDQMKQATKYVNTALAGYVKYEYCLSCDGALSKRLQYNSSDELTSEKRYEYDGLNLLRVDERCDADGDGIVEAGETTWRMVEVATHRPGQLGALLLKSRDTTPILCLFLASPRSCLPSERFGRSSNYSGKASTPTGHPVHSWIQRWTTSSSLVFLERSCSQPCISDGSGSILTMGSSHPLKRASGLLLENRCGVPRFSRFSAASNDANQLDNVPFAEGCLAEPGAVNNLFVALDHGCTGTQVQVFQKREDSRPFLELAGFSIYGYFHGRLAFPSSPALLPEGEGSKNPLPPGEGGAKRRVREIQD